MVRLRTPLLLSKKCGESTVPGRRTQFDHTPVDRKVDYAAMREQAEKAPYTSFEPDFGETDRLPLIETKGELQQRSYKPVVSRQEKVTGIPLDRIVGDYETNRARFKKLNKSFKAGGFGNEKERLELVRLGKSAYALAPTQKKKYLFASAVRDR